MIIVSSFFISICLVSGVFAIIVESPVALGGLTVVLVTGVSIVISAEVGVFVGFTLFIVVVGGMLVVFAYAAALSHSTSFSFKNYNLSASLMMLFCWILADGWISCYSPASGWNDYQYGSSPHFDLTWGVVILFLSLILLLMMVAAADMSSRNRGALVSGV